MKSLGCCGLLILILGWSSLFVAIFDGVRPWVRPLAIFLMIMAFVMMGVCVYIEMNNDKKK